MKSLICITCPRGCHLEVDDNMKVTGNSCIRGEKYAIQELTAPKRMITSTVRIESSNQRMLPVMTNAPIPKDRIFDVMKELAKVRVKAPIKIHDVIIENVLDLGVDIIATKSIIE